MVARLNVPCLASACLVWDHLLVESPSLRLEVVEFGLGDRIKQAREARRRPVTQMAKEIGISRNYWYRLEAEAVLGGVAEETLRKIEEVLGVDLGVQFDD